MLGFLASGILQDGSVPFHMNLFALKKEVLFFLASGILEDGSVFFFMNLLSFLLQDCFFNDSVCFFCFRYFGRRFCGLSHCFFNESVVFLVQGILEDGSVAFFHVNS